VNESWVPKASQRAEAIVSVGKSGRSGGQTRWAYNLSFRNARDGRIWTIGAYNLDTFEMRKPQIEWRLPDDSRRTLIATNAVRQDGIWIFHEVLELTYPSPVTTNALLLTNVVAHRMQTNVLNVPEFSETPEQIQSEIRISRLSSVTAAKEVQLSLAEIVNFLHLHPDLAPGDIQHRMLHTQLHGRLAASWTPFVVVLIAIPFGAASRRRNVFVGVASSIFIAFGYFMILRLGLALGTGGYLPPWLAAWSPNMVFAGTCLLLTRFAR
jgi:lipopolysaccharide export LptBFGC system permease protein LptF